MLDLDRVRRDTPGCLDKVFTDSAGSSLPPQVVLDTMRGHLELEATIGGYRAGAERLGELAAVKSSIGRLIGADATSIALSDSATRAWCDFFYSIPLGPDDRVLISESEYAATAIAALQRTRNVDVVPSDATGQIDLDALERMLDEHVKVVSVVHIPTNNGLVNPVRAVAERAHAVGALVLLDACQSVGQVRVNVAELDVDALSATGRKWLRGPRGTGFLYVRPDLIERIEPHVLDLHSAEWTGPSEFRIAADATRFEMWECDVAARLGLGAAVDYLLELGPEDVFDAVAERGARLRAQLAPTATVRDIGARKGGIVTFTVDGIAPVDIRDRLAARGVTVTVSHRSSTLLDMTHRGLDSVVRASPHYFVSHADLDRFAHALSEVVAESE